MNALVLQVTAAGRAALVNAQNTGTLPLLVSQIGVTDQAFTAAADGSDVALPGELKRLSTFAGDAVADDTIHVSITDSSADVYDMRGFAMYFDDGTLFALYGQADPIMQKSAQAMMLLALDAIFQTIDVTGLTFGDTNFALPPATTDRAGIVELATDDETITGTDTQRAVVPKSLKAALDARFGAGAPSAFVKSLLTAATALACRTALGIKLAATFDPGAGKGLDADLLDGQHGAYYRAWANLTGVPAVFPPSAHQHAWTDITGKPETATRWPAWLEVTDKPATFPPAPHSQDWGTITGKPETATRWPAWGEVTAKPTFGTASAKNVEFFATAAQGAKADTAMQPSATQTVSGIKTFAPGGGGAFAYPQYASIICGARSADATRAAIVLNPTTDSNNALTIEFSSGTNAIEFRDFGAAAAVFFSVKRSGEVTATGAVSAPGFDSAASSRTVKHDIAPCRYGLAEFLQIPWVEYRYNESITKDGRLRFGSIVEDVEPIAPELVIHRKGQVPTFEYDQFIPVIGRALQQYIARADARADKAKARADGLEQLLQALADRVALLEAR